MKRTVVIGTRGSDLALWQANFVRVQLEEHFPDRHFEIKVIVTTGDEVMDIALSKIGDKGLFTRQIEAELLSGEIDLAVHSLKDLQTSQPKGLTIGAICERELPNDVLISRSGLGLSELPTGAKVATGSLRRRSQLLQFRPDLNVEEIRGNVPTRIRKFDDSNLDGLVLAYAGVHRLGLEGRITEVIPPDVMLSAVGQGAIAVETRANDEEIGPIVAKLDHAPSRICTTAERAFLKRLDGGCQVPIGALASIGDDAMSISGFVGSLDGSVCFRETIAGRLDEPAELGTRLADILIERGARDVLDGARSDAVAASEAVL